MTCWYCKYRVRLPYFDDLVWLMCLKKLFLGSNRVRSVASNPPKQLESGLLVFLMTIFCSQHYERFLRMFPKEFQTSLFYQMLVEINSSSNIMHISSKFSFAIRHPRSNLLTHTFTHTRKRIQRSETENFIFSKTC